MKKLATMAISIVLIACMVAGGSLAYLTSEDSTVNVMTLGNVKITQHEYERVTNADGTYKTDTIDNQTSYVLKAFTQDKPLFPATEPTNNGAGPWDTTTVRMSQVKSHGGMQVFESKNAQDKFVTVENTGKSDAYVRTFVAIEVGTADADLIGTSYHNTWKSNDIGTIAIDGVNYYVTEYVYAGGQLSDGTWRHENGVLPAKDTTYPNLSQVYLKSEATNEDMDKIDGNKNGKLDIIVLSQAVQAQGFDSAVAALNAGFPYGENYVNVAEWFGGAIKEAATDKWELGEVDKTWFDADKAAAATAENPVTFEVATAEEFAGFINLANTNSFENVTIKLTKDIDLAGTNWNEGGTLAAYGPAFSGTFDGNGHTISNLTASNNWTYANGLFRTIGHDVTIKNLVIEDANINNAAASGKNKEYGILIGIVGGGNVTLENITVRDSSVSAKTSVGILVGGMTEGAIYYKDITIENCDVVATSATGVGAALLGDGWSAHDYDYAGVFTDNVKVINCTYTINGVQQSELPLYNYNK